MKGRMSWLRGPSVEGARPTRQIRNCGEIERKLLRPEAEVVLSSVVARRPARLVRFLQPDASEPSQRTQRRAPLHRERNGALRSPFPRPRAYARPRSSTAATRVNLAAASAQKQPQAAPTRDRCFARHCERAARRSRHCRVGRDPGVPWVQRVGAADVIANVPRSSGARSARGFCSAGCIRTSQRRCAGPAVQGLVLSASAALGSYHWLAGAREGGTGEKGDAVTNATKTLTDLVDPTRWRLSPFACGATNRERWSRC